MASENVPPPLWSPFLSFPARGPLLALCHNLNPWSVSAGEPLGGELDRSSNIYEVSAKCLALCPARWGILNPRRRLGPHSPVCSNESTVSHRRLPERCSRNVPDYQCVGRRGQWIWTWDLEADGTGFRFWLWEHFLAVLPGQSYNFSEPQFAHL